MIRKNRLGDMSEVENKLKHFAANSTYNHIRAQFPNGEEKSLLFTDNEIKKALERANKNPEDLPKVSWIRNILD